jgi:hypothetical protein
MVFSEQAERPDTLIGCTMPFFSNPTPLERIAVSLKSLRRLPALATADMDTMRRIAFNIINGFEGMHQQSMLFADPNANNILVDDTTLAVKFNHMGSDFIKRALVAVAGFQTFTSGNNVHLERDYGVFELDTYRLMFKIDYLDVDGVYASDDPSDPAQTLRVMTIMFASEY